MCCAKLGELPDLWDFAMGSWGGGSVHLGFAPEGRQEEVRRQPEADDRSPSSASALHLPDAMVRQIKAGILDLIRGRPPVDRGPVSCPNKIPRRPA